MKVKLHQDVYASIIIFIFSIFFFIRSLQYPPASAFYPALLMGLMGFCNIFVLINGIRKTLRMEKNSISLDVIKKPLLVLLFIFAYTLLFRFFGYFIATPVFIIGFMLYFKDRNWKHLVLVPVFFMVFIYLLFVRLFETPLF